MRRAIPIETVRAYVEDQFAQAEAVYERAVDLTPDPRNPEWSKIWTRYAWLHWLLAKALRRAERVGVGAVLALDLGDGLLEQLALIGEQLHAQGRIVEPYSTTPVGTVPRDLTADAARPYWVSATVLSASAERWQRYEEGIERRLWQINRDLGGATPIPGFESAHRHAEAAACHYAAYRQLQTSGSAAAAAEADERRVEARDRIAEEMASLIRILSDHKRKGGAP